MSSFVLLALFVAANSYIPSKKLQNSATNDSFIPLVGLGTAIPAYPNESYVIGFQSVTKWLSIGGRFIDEAWCYSSKYGVAAGLLNYTNNYSTIKRSEIFLQTKVGGCGGEYLGYNSAIQQIKNDLVLYNTSYLDSVLIHWCSAVSVTYDFSIEPVCNPANTTYFNATLCRQKTWKALIEL
eukprot:477819_1